MKQVMVHDYRSRQGTAARSTSWTLLLLTVVTLSSLPSSAMSTQSTDANVPRLVVVHPTDVLPSVSAISCSPDGTMLAGAVWPDGRVGLWDLRTATMIRQFRDLKGAVQSLFLSPDGSLLAAGGDSPEVYIWSVQTGDLVYTLHTMPTDNGYVSRVCFSPNGEKLATTSRYNPDGRWRTETIVWDVVSSTRESVLPGCAFEAFISGGEFVTARIHAGDSDEKNLRNITLSRLDAPEQGRLMFSESSRINALGCTPDGKTLACATDGGLWLRYDDDRRSSRRLEGNFGEIRGLIFTPDAANLMIVSVFSRRGLLSLIDTTSGAFQKQKAQDRFTSFGMAPDRSFLAFGREAIEIWDVSGQTLRVLLYLSPWTADKAPQWVSYTPDGYFKKSEGVEPSLRWREAGRTVPFDAHAKTFDHPEIVVKALHPKEQ
jgi:WD40 repeat protein